jgi:hypothetical protein
MPWMDEDRQQTRSLIAAELTVTGTMDYRPGYAA